MIGKSILWRRLDQPGHDAARFRFQDPFWCLEGTAVFVEDGLASRLNYRIFCTPAWSTVRGEVSGWIGEKIVDVKFSADPARRWKFNGLDWDAVAGCVDADLGFTPATNMFPIRRLQLPVGNEAVVRSAWLRFPEFTFEVLEQKYHRVGADTYRYETLDGKFRRDLTVDEAGFVTRYPGLWEVETGKF